MKKTVIIGTIIAVGLLTLRMFILKKPSTDILYVVKKEDLIESVKVSGTFYKTALDEDRALAYANYENALSALKLSNQSKLSADAGMWTKQKTLLDAQNAVDYKNNNSTNTTTKKDFTDLEKYSIDSSLTQAQKDFTASETKYREADAVITAANAQVAAAKIKYDDLLTSEPVVSIDVNEVYLPRISIGQRATIIFDALKNKALSGVVKSMDLIGTVKGGVVTYEVKVSSNYIPQEIKPNMTAIVTIETLRKNNIFLVPNGALIHKNSKFYIETIINGQKIVKEVNVGKEGIVKTEIKSGLETGVIIVVNPNN